MTERTASEQPDRKRTACPECKCGEGYCPAHSPHDPRDLFLAEYEALCRKYGMMFAVTESPHGDEVFNTIVEIDNPVGEDFDRYDLDAHISDIKARLRQDSGVEK